MSQEIPYKIYLEENELPDSWYNVRADTNLAIEKFYFSIFYHPFCLWFC